MTLFHKVDIEILKKNDIEYSQRRDIFNKVAEDFDDSIHFITEKNTEDIKKNARQMQSKKVKMCESTRENKEFTSTMSNSMKHVLLCFSE